MKLFLNEGRYVRIARSPTIRRAAVFNTDWRGDSRSLGRLEGSLQWSIQEQMKACTMEVKMGIDIDSNNNNIKMFSLYFRISFRPNSLNSYGVCGVLDHILFAS